MKIAVGIIVFNSDFVLKQVLDSIYPHVDQILISEGCVNYWVQKGFTQSQDNTIPILRKYPDPDRKITIVHGTYAEKTEQANAYMKYVNPDTDYVWNMDADEVFKSEDIKKIIEVLKKDQPTSMGFKAYSFYGGFEHYLTGFDHDHEFIRIRKYPHPGAMWVNHRPPTLEIPKGKAEFHISANYMHSIGVNMYHYSYVFPRQVFEKIAYYEAAVIKKDGCIPNYFNEVYLPWVIGNDQERAAIEQKYKGVHEFVPETRGDCYTARFTGYHPFAITRDMKDLKKQFTAELTPFLLERSLLPKK